MRFRPRVTPGTIRTPGGWGGTTRGREEYSGLAGSSRRVLKHSDRASTPKSGGTRSSAVRRRQTLRLCKGSSAHYLSLSALECCATRERGVVGGMPTSAWAWVGVGQGHAHAGPWACHTAQSARHRSGSRGWRSRRKIKNLCAPARRWPRLLIIVERVELCLGRFKVTTSERRTGTNLDDSQRA